MNWIKVTDKLPNHSDFEGICPYEVMLISARTKSEDCLVFAFAKWYEDKGWSIISDTMYSDIGVWWEEIDSDDVTHWMHIDKPKEL